MLYDERSLRTFFGLLHRPQRVRRRRRVVG